MTHTNKMSYFASFCALNHLILQISSSKTILFCIFLWVMLVLVDLRVLEEEGENRDGRWSNLNKKHFLGTGSWVGVRSVFSRSSLGGRRQGIREVKEIGILRKVLFCANACGVTLWGRVAKRRGKGSRAAVIARSKMSAKCTILTRGESREH